MHPAEDGFGDPHLPLLGLGDQAQLVALEGPGEEGFLDAVGLLQAHPPVPPAGKGPPLRAGLLYRLKKRHVPSLSEKSTPPAAHWSRRTS